MLCFRAVCICNYPESRVSQRPHDRVPTGLNVKTRCDPLLVFNSDSRVTPSRQLGDLIYDFSNVQPSQTRHCLQLAQRVYVSTGSHVQAMVCMVRLGNVETALEHAQRHQCGATQLVQVHTTNSFCKARRTLWKCFKNMPMTLRISLKLFKAVSMFCFGFISECATRFINYRLRDVKEVWDWDGCVWIFSPFLSVFLLAGFLAISSLFLHLPSPRLSPPIHIPLFQPLPSPSSPFPVTFPLQNPARGSGGALWAAQWAFTKPRG